MVTVLIPTYRRPQDLARCLEALRVQTRPPEETLVVRREGDELTQAFLDARLSQAKWPGVRAVVTTQPGQVAALNAGMEAACGDIIAILDDDAAPRPDWLARIVAHFENDTQVGGVGGLDKVHHPTPQGIIIEDGAQAIVGKLTAWGRLIGGHHLGIGAAREVDFLKGANMSFRRSALFPPNAPLLRFDDRLRGTGAQVHNDLAFCLSVRRAGWKLIYDPAIVVDHYEAPRFDEDARGKFDAQAHVNGVYNEALTLLEHLPAGRRSLYLVYSLLVGSRYAPGLLQLARLRLRGELHPVSRWKATQQGRRDALSLFRSGILPGASASTAQPPQRNTT